MLRLLTLLMAACFMAQAAFAQELLIITEQNAPYNFTLEGQPSGISVDILLLVAEKAGIQLSRADIQFWPWARGYQALKKKDNVILFSTGRIQQREKLFQWIGPIMSLKSCLYSLRKANIRVTDLASAGQIYQFGTLRDSGSEQYLIKKGVPTTSMQRVHRQELNIKKLMGRRIDIMPALEANFLYNLKKMNLPINPFQNVKVLFSADVYYAASKSMDPAIVKRLQEAMDSLRADGSIDAIIAHYLY